MARRKTSPAEDIFELLTICPWYVSVIIAIIVYALLKYYLPTVRAEGIFTKALIQTIPSFAWAFALFLLIPAPISAIKSYQKKTLLKKQRDLSTIRALEWRDFEFMVAQAYRQQGFRVVENQHVGPDDGIDILIEKDGNRYVVQCKQWQSNKVGVSVVREMFGVMHAGNAHGVIIVTSGMFTQEARNFAHGKPIDLVEGKALVDLVKNSQATGLVGDEPVEQESPAKEPFDITKVKCPYCDSPLTKRVAKRGENVGKRIHWVHRVPEM